MLGTDHVICRRASIAGALLLTLLAVVRPVLADNLEVAAISGQLAPDGSGELSEFGNPVIGKSREPTFAAVIRENGFFVKSALFRVGASGDLVLIVDEGRPAPDGNGNFGALSGLIPWINDAGQIAFEHSFEMSLGGITDSSAMVVGRGGAAPLQIAARANQMIPDSGGDRLGFTIIPLSLNNAGEAALSNQTAVENDLGIWRSDQGVLTRVVGTGDPNPTGDGVLSGGIFLPTFSQLNDAGQVGFHDITDTSSGNLNGIYRGASPASIGKMARRLDVAPGGGRFFSFFSLLPPVGGTLAINGRGDVSFFAVLDQTPGGATDNVGLFLGTDSGTLGPLIPSLIHKLG